MKKEGSVLFDVAMGSYEGAEVCELVGMFGLSQLRKRYNRGDIGLYRDDGLAVFRGMSRSMAEDSISLQQPFYMTLLDFIETW